MLNPSEIIDVLKSIEYKTIFTNKKIWYYNIVASFDIEVSSFKSINMDKQCCMYMWSFAIYDKVIIGRTWKEFFDMMEEIEKYLELCKEKRMIIYVHNLSYEFQFIRKYFEWESVFSLEKRKPVKAVTKSGFEFRCSYLLSGYGLEKLADQLTWHNVKKLVGYLDYKLVRTPQTKLTEKEYEYSANDVLVVTAYIEEQAKECGDITKIPLTKTGYVRRYMRNKCLYDDKKHKNNDTYKKYRALIRKLTLTENIYLKLKESFSGGFTHANPIYSGEILQNVKSFDFTSSYPAVMVSEKFPMSTFEEVYPNDEEELFKYVVSKACIITIHIYGLKTKTLYENYISKSHCSLCKKPIENNGRIVSAEEIITTVTEQDLMIIFNMYTWEDMQIEEMYIAEKAYLPKPIIEGVLKLYGDKTTLKEVEGKEAEYMRSKENINSVFGMTVTDICRDEILYDEEWDKEKPNLEEQLNKYNKSVKRFLYYAWGVWVTAYARANLFTGILEFKDDYCYSDTDSIKVLNYKNHMGYINAYNEQIIQKINKCLKSYDIDIELARPKNKKGKVKQLGVWNEEELYLRFKTLGAKRYMTEFINDKGNKEISMTVSGVNKKKALPYLLKEYGEEKIFEEFTENLEIPAEYMNDGKLESATGKLTHTYIDNEICGVVKDYQGNYFNYHELSGIHMEGCNYKLTLSDLYVEYLLGIKNNSYMTD